MTCEDHIPHSFAFRLLSARSRASAQEAMCARGLSDRSDGFDGRENRDPWSRIAEYVSKINGVLHDITFRLQVGIDVEGSIGQ